MKEELIQSVQLTPVLWDKTHRQHHNRHVLEKEWKKIATKLGATDKQVRFVWKNLRQEFGKQLKKTLKSGSAAPEEPCSSWPYFESMLFLTDQFIPRASSGNLASNQDDNSSIMESEGGEEERIEEEVQNTEDEPIIFATSPSANGASGNSIHFKKFQNLNTVKTKTGYLKRVTPQTVIGEQLLELEKEKLQMKKSKAAVNPNDEDVGFFNSLLPHVKQLTPRDKLRFRMQVQSILFDMAYPPEQSRTTSSTSYGALSPQPTTSAGPTYLFDLRYDDATTGITNPDGGYYLNL